MDRADYLEKKHEMEQKENNSMNLSIEFIEHYSICFKNLCAVLFSRSRES